MTITNDELNKMAWDKQYLIKQKERKEIDEETYEQKINELNVKVSIKIEQLIALEKKIEEGRKNMAETKQEEKVEETKIGRKTNEGSYTMLIIKALSQKGLKTVDAVVDKVDEQKPGRDKKKIKGQVGAIIGLVSKQKGKRWEKYNWNKEEFLLTEK